MLAFTNGIFQKNPTKTNPDWSDLCRFPNISVLVQGEYHRCSRDIYSFGLMVQGFKGLELCESVCVTAVDVLVPAVLLCSQLIELAAVTIKL